MPAIEVYLGSPGNQLQADAVRGQRVLVSFASWHKFKGLSQWMPSFDDLLLDSGAYSEMNSGVAIDLPEYVAWAQSIPWATAWAGLDDIGGDHRRSILNYKSGGFPTFHDTDPVELLDELVDLARARGGWLGIGLRPPRQSKERWVRDTLERIPDDIHVHGWALGLYTHVPGLRSIDSTHWWREAMKFRGKMPWLTYGEALEIAVKKVQREHRIIEHCNQMPLLMAAPKEPAS